jgi:superfamily I DNA and/or RNA helicase
MIQELIQQAVQALQAEIETVREKPSTDILYGGVYQKNPASSKTADYKFETHQPAIRFAEQIKARKGEKEWAVSAVAFEGNQVMLRFEEFIGNSIDELFVEWENDFVLKRTLREVERLTEEKNTRLKRVERMFSPSDDPVPNSVMPDEDGHRNEAQIRAIELAMQQKTVFVWGPPGTGKTATLGYIIANYLKQGKSVLFASNTNRAVDVGLISVMDALRATGNQKMVPSITRFGESALDDERIKEVLFDEQIQKSVRHREQEAAEWIDLLSRYKKLKEAIEKRKIDGKPPTKNQELDLLLMQQKMESEGGAEILEDRIAEMRHVNEMVELRKKKLVATTLAKVCVSELFGDMDFDAVVVDEGSMANLPYLMVLAAKAQWHLVIVGDPMQLPPIALTENETAREFLEKDIFTTVSAAATTEALFDWHDENPEFTAFFDTQYRLEASLADIISTVFYDGRLKTGKVDDAGNTLLSGSNGVAYQLVDTSKYKPSLSQKGEGKGFQPVNEVHLQIGLRLVRALFKKNFAPEEIGIIVPFRSVVYEYRNRMFEENIRGVEVGTIHTFQGREKPVIIFDMVMSGDVQYGGVRHYSVRPLDESKNGLSVPRLLNVAFSRSQKELYILADMNHIRRIYGKKFVGKLLNRLL